MNTIYLIQLKRCLRHTTKRVFISKTAILERKAMLCLYLYFKKHQYAASRPRETAALRVLLLPIGSMGFLAALPTRASHARTNWKLSQFLRDVALELQPLQYCNDSRWRDWNRSSGCERCSLPFAGTGWQLALSVWLVYCLFA